MPDERGIRRPPSHFATRCRPWGIGYAGGRMPKPPTEATCPACKHVRPLPSQKGLLAAERAFVAACSRDLAPGSPFAPREDGMRRLASERGGHPRWFWACDPCIKAGRALTADVTKQVLGLGTPFAAYIERPFICEDCGARSVFTPKEQKHWFENLGFLIWVYPKQCGPCRAKRRARARTSARLAESLSGLDPTNASQLDAIARLYDELGHENKAATFRARAANRVARSKARDAT